MQTKSSKILKKQKKKCEKLRKDIEHIQVSVCGVSVERLWSVCGVGGRLMDWI